MLVRALSLGVVPVDVPSLAEVDVEHLLLEDLVEGQMVLLVDVLVHFHDGLEIHEVTCVNGNVGSKLMVSAKIATTLKATIFKIVDNKRPVVDNFSESTGKVDVLVRLEVFKVISAKALGYHES